MKATTWAQIYTNDPQMMFIFDDRQAGRRESKVIFNVFQTKSMPPPEPVGVFFNTSHKLLPLQAADLIAREFYQYAKDALESGMLGLPKLHQFPRLRQGISVFDLQIARRTIKCVAAMGFVGDIATSPDNSIATSLNNHQRRKGTGNKVPVSLAT